MIVGNSTWETELAAAQKRPLYYLVIDSLQIYVTSFEPGDVDVITSGGYGTAYGSGYGTE
ncbi:MAG TPA: hypothetical protein VFC10_07480 [Terriglobia bacterium]|jgi:hypothetical protein|nr:hypothetical protein [Terracidiphilus sp.]HZT69575.1 hypothetical protein [Terriglobia bacterium]